MSNLLTRIKNTIMADLHEALDQKEKQNPIALLNQYLRECEQETEKVRKLLERQYMLKEEFTKEHAHAVQMASKRKQQAEMASQAGENELYLLAETEQQQYAERTQRLSNSLDQITEQLSELERKYQEMKHKLKDMNIRRLELMGRENISRANHKINQVLESDTFANKAFSRFGEIDNYLDRLEKRVNESFHRSTIDARIAQLEKDRKMEESKSIS